MRDGHARADLPEVRSTYAERQPASSRPPPTAATNSLNSLEAALADIPEGVTVDVIERWRRAAGQAAVRGVGPRDAVRVERGSLPSAQFHRTWDANVFSGLEVGAAQGSNVGSNIGLPG